MSKNKYLIVRFTPKQHDLLSKIARAHGKSISETIRESALYGIINAETLAIVTKEELADALDMDVALIDYFLTKSWETPPRMAVGRPRGEP
jgi:uncharacterized protein (DUF1778 family)